MKIFISLLLLSCAVFAQQSTSSKINDVTVYLSGAKITRVASVQLDKGSNELVMTKLSPDIDESSIRVSDLDGLRLLGLNYDIKRSEEKVKGDRFKALQSRIDSASTAVERIDAKTTGLSEELSLLQSNRSLNNKDTGLSLEQIKSFGRYYNLRTEEITNSQYNLSNKRNELNTLLQELRLDQQQLDPTVNNSQGQITLKLYSTLKKTTAITVSYNVQNAGWVPIYDIFAAGTSSTLALDFKAQVYQETGTDWDNVPLKLSTGDPNIDNTRPVLEKKKLQFVTYNYNSNATSRSNKRYNPTVRTISGKVTDADGQSLLGVTVSVPGTSNATTTDLDGNYVINVNGGREINFSYVGYEPVRLPVYASTINQVLSYNNAGLDAVVVVGYGTRSKLRKSEYSDDMVEEAPAVVTSIEENIASRTFELSQAYSIPSTGETTDITISSDNIAATYEYYAAPVINENVFLTAIIKDYEQLNLIPGEANVYFDDAYTSKIYFDTDTTEDELIISLGVDPQITIKREDKKDFKSKSFLGSTRIVEKNYEITLKNNRKNDISLKLQDRIPVSSNNDIKVDQEETGDAQVDKESNILTWIVALNSGQQVKKQFAYRIKYPKSRRINDN